MTQKMFSFDSNRLVSNGAPEVIGEGWTITLLKKLGNGAYLDADVLLGVNQDGSLTLRHGHFVVNGFSNIRQVRDTIFNFFKNNEDAALEGFSDYLYAELTRMYILLQEYYGVYLENSTKGSDHYKDNVTVYSYIRGRIPRSDMGDKVAELLDSGKVLEWKTINAPLFAKAPDCYFGDVVANEEVEEEYQTLEVFEGDFKGYLGYFRDYRYQVSGSPTGVRDYGSSSTVDGLGSAISRLAKIDKSYGEFYAKSHMWEALNKFNFNYHDLVDADDNLQKLLDRTMSYIR